MTNQSLLPVTQKDREAYLSLNMLPPDDPDEYWVFLADAAIAAILGGE